ncbi:MAG: hypothetical protein MSA24_05315, partial [Selenomonadaceae bacterium]|nr:hypothetical protein [Selenomonadaceae bacterium]
ADLLQSAQGAAWAAVAGKLIGYALQDEPVAGLSKYKRAGELLQAYLELQAENAEPELVRAIKAFVEGHELANKWQLVELCNKILA